MYLCNRPTGELKAYIDWILSPEGQKLVTDIGYFPVK
jgi:phosphate transport system substrate-binding protein